MCKGSQLDFLEWSIYALMGIGRTEKAKHPATSPAICSVDVALCACAVEIVVLSGLMPSSVA